MHIVTIALWTASIAKACTNEFHLQRNFSYRINRIQLLVRITQQHCPSQPVFAVDVNTFHILTVTNATLQNVKFSLL